MMNNMLIYFNGDSFTEGAGLSDHAFFPNEYPGNLSTMEDVLKTKWPDKRDQLINNDIELIKKIRLADNERAYPNYIKNLTGANIINAGVGGSSMMGILLRTLYELEELLSMKKIPTHVFIGLTYKERITIPNVTIEVDSRTLSHAIIPGFEHLNLLTQYSKYAKQFWNSHTDDQILVHHLLDLITIKLYVEKKFNITPIFLNTHGYGDNDASICEHSDSPLIKMLWEMLDAKYLLDSKSLYSFKTNFVADGHVTEDAHEKFARWVVDTYLK